MPVGGSTRPPDSWTLGRGQQSPARPALPSLLGALLAHVPPAESQPTATVLVLKLRPPGLRRHCFLCQNFLCPLGCVAGWLLTSSWPWLQRCALRVCPERIPRWGRVHAPLASGPSYKSPSDVFPLALIGSPHRRQGHGVSSAAVSPEPRTVPDLDAQVLVGPASKYTLQRVSAHPEQALIAPSTGAPSFPRSLGSC